MRVRIATSIYVSMRLNIFNYLIGFYFCFVFLVVLLFSAIISTQQKSQPFCIIVFFCIKLIDKFIKLALFFSCACFIYEWLEKKVCAYTKI